MLVCLTSSCCCTEGNVWPKIGLPVNIETWQTEMFWLWTSLYWISSIIHQMYKRYRGKKKTQLVYLLHSSTRLPIFIALKTCDVKWVWSVQVFRSWVINARVYYYFYAIIGHLLLYRCLWEQRSVFLLSINAVDTSVQFKIQIYNP